MGYPDHCAICGESYDNDNLMPCSGCGREVCYRCGSQFRGLCQRCGNKRAASEAGEGAPPPPASGV